VTEDLLSGLCYVALYYVSKLKKLFGASLGFVRRPMYGFCANWVTAGEESSPAYYFLASLRGVTAARSSSLVVV